MLTDLEALADAPHVHYIADESPVWVTDDEGELVLFITFSDGEIREWVWL